MLLEAHLNKLLIYTILIASTITPFIGYYLDLIAFFVVSLLMLIFTIYRTFVLLNRPAIKITNDSITLLNSIVPVTINLENIYDVNYTTIKENAIYIEIKNQKRGQLIQNHYDVPIKEIYETLRILINKGEKR